MGEPRDAGVLRRRYGAPEAVRIAADGVEVRAWVEGAERAVEEVARAPDELPHEGPPLVGRGRLARLASPLGPLVVREARKGGLLRRLRGPLFHGRYRPLDELVLLLRCLGARVPVAEPAGAVVLHRGGGWRGFLLTREVPDAVDLERFLYDASPLPAGRREVLAEAGAAVRRLHDAGVSHADLHPKNLLLDPHGDRVLVIDLDRAREMQRPLTEDERLDNLARLARSIEKHRLRGMRVGRREALRFLIGYGGSPAEGERLLGLVRARLLPGLRARILWWKATGQARPRGREPHGGAPAVGRA
jgi:hypothetical protein